MCLTLERRATGSWLRIRTKFRSAKTKLKEAKSWGNTNLFALLSCIILIRDLSGKRRSRICNSLPTPAKQFARKYMRSWRKIKVQVVPLSQWQLVRNVHLRRRYSRRCRLPSARSSSALGCQLNYSWSWKKSSACDTAFSIVANQKITVEQVLTDLCSRRFRLPIVRSNPKLWRASPG